MLRRKPCGAGDSSAFTRQSLLESLESRLFKTTSTSSSTSDTISSLSGTYIAQVQIGDNGGYGDVPGSAIAVGGTETASAPVEWSSDMSNGLDSGWRAVDFSIDTSTSDSTSLSVEDADTITSSTAGSASFSQVAISAAVDQWGMSIQWQNVEVQFYRGTTLVDSAVIGSVKADTTNADTNDPYEAVTTVSTNAANVDHIVVTATVRMISDQGVYPADTDIFGQVAVS